MKRLENLNFYEILEVSPDASQVEIRKAYERAKRTYNSDSIAVYSLLSEKEIEEISRLVEEAYHTIGNEKRRREYDRMLGGVERREAEMIEPSFYEHLAQPGTPSVQEESNRVSPEQREKIEEMISQSEFEFTGPALRKIREALGLDLTEISVQTKVSRANLCFIEEENYAHLPALVYLKGFVIEYAKCLGLDSSRVLEDYVGRYRSWEKNREARPNLL